MKVDEKHPNYKPIILTSAGIGNQFTNSADFHKHKFKGTDTKEYYRTRTGLKVSLPIYFRNKLYTEEERSLTSATAKDKVVVKPNSVLELDFKHQIPEKTNNIPMVS